MRVGTFVKDFTRVKHYFSPASKELSGGLRDTCGAVNLSGQARERNVRRFPTFTGTLEWTANTESEISCGIRRLAALRG